MANNAQWCIEVHGNSLDYFNAMAGAHGAEGKGDDAHAKYMYKYVCVHLRCSMNQRTLTQPTQAYQIHTHIYIQIDVCTCIYLFALTIYFVVLLCKLLCFCVFFLFVLAFSDARLLLSLAVHVMSWCDVTPSINNTKNYYFFIVFMYLCTYICMYISRLVPTYYLD